MNVPLNNKNNTKMHKVKVHHLSLPVLSLSLQPLNESEPFLDFHCSYLHRQDFAHKDRLCACFCYNRIVLFLLLFNFLLFNYLSWPLFIIGCSSTLYFFPNFKIIIPNFKIIIPLKWDHPHRFLCIPFFLTHLSFLSAPLNPIKF